MKRARADLRSARRRENADENNATDGVAQIHRHRHGIARCFSKGRGGDFDNPEPQRDSRHLVQASRCNACHHASLKV